MGRQFQHIVSPSLLSIAFFVVCICFLMPGPIAALTINVVGVDNTVSPPQETPVNGWRWLVEEDATHHIQAGNPATNMATDFHKSYMPLARLTNGQPAKGHSLVSSTPQFAC